MKFQVIALAAIASLFPFFANAERESGGRLSANAVYVDFTSYGTGIDYPTLKLSEQLISEAQEAGQVVDSTKEQKGREGETRICVQFTDASLRVEFVKAVAPHVVQDREQTPVSRTSVRVGLDCSSFDDATEQDLSKY